MSNEALEFPTDPNFSGVSVDSTGLVRMTGDLEIKPGKLSVKLPPFLGYIFDAEEMKAFKVQFQ